MGIVTMRTATSGFLQRLLNREFGLSEDDITRMCIKYVLSTPEIDVALVGMRNPEEVETNIALASDLGDRYNLDELHNRFR
jgi:predicted aldo/keto reductase-like oxidoreductase